MTLEKRYMTVLEASEVLQVSEATVKKLCAAGVLPSFKVGRLWRIDPNDLHDYINAGKTANQEQPSQDI